MRSLVSRSEGPGAKHIRAARQIFLDDVVLRSALKPGAGRALLVRNSDIERHQPAGRGVDRHRCIHRHHRDVFEQRPHVADMRNRDADLADFAARERMIAVVAGLSRKVEGDRQAGLALAEIVPIELVRLFSSRMPSVSPEYPRFVAFDRRAFPCHRRPRSRRLPHCAEHKSRKGAGAPQSKGRRPLAPEKVAHIGESHQQDSDRAKA